jgi:hypothetical protein
MVGFTPDASPPHRDLLPVIPARVLQDRFDRGIGGIGDETSEQKGKE